uniref:Polyhydroxyalkanoate granule-associated protein PhaF n=1 Tax=uncultured bacterium A1Q1_fos_500 TaxID=1256579 RepID=L7VSH0_9BACT|nr:polyhydroxyalkanoate granule-associated protein PhaF [uncultured bacterium A1Q1_fos_500]
MVKKLQKSSAALDADTTTAAPAGNNIKESAQQIWLAGLGAFAKAQQGGGKVFESLVQEGLSVQRKTQAVAEERIADATNRVTGMANDITAKATGQWDKLESIFEERVSRALNKLGVPTAQDIELLIARIEELNRHVQALQPQTGIAEDTSAAPAKKPASRKKTVVTEVAEVTDVESKSVVARKSSKTTNELASEANTASA